MTAADDLLRNNERYAESFRHGDLSAPPRRKVAVVSCMDARVDVYRLLGLEVGDAHVIRNAGGVVTEDVIRSLVISQRLLGTEEIMLIPHTDCGMTKLREDEVKDEIERDTGIRPPFALEAFRDAAANVRESVARLLASPFLVTKDHIRGFLYDVRTGRLTELEPR